MNLTEIGLKHGTDKANYHGFTHHYEPKFQHLRDKPITLLEIGVYKGGSVRMWHEYFQNGKIVGCDINILIDPVDRLELIEGSYIDQQCFEQIISHGPFDIIVDDADHEASSQIKGFEMFFDHLKPGGTFVIEDLHMPSSHIAINYINQTIAHLPNVVNAEVIRSQYSKGYSVTSFIDKAE